MVSLPLARQPPQSPPFTAAPTKYPLVRIKHPGYGDLPNNTLLTLPAVDSIGLSSSGRSWGLHHRTALTAGAIIANNAFDKAYFSHDQKGRERVTTPLDGILIPGDYWLQLKGREPASGPGTDTALTAAVSSSVSPPPGAEPSTSSHNTPTRTPSSRNGDEEAHVPYEIVPSFGDWQFPHNKLPLEWKLPHTPPPGQQDTNPLPMAQETTRCYLTDFRMGINKCHLIPSEKSDWFGINGMARYASSPTSTINDESNLAILRADFYQLFGRRRFSIVPKPSTTLPSRDSLLSTLPAEPQPNALVIHVLEDDKDNGEFPDLYQNASIQPKYVSKLSREFLFARFAWALFPLLRPFLQSSTPRYLTVRVKDKDGSSMLPDFSHPNTVWMNGAEFMKHLDQRGESRTRSRKRRPAQRAQDGETDTEDDAYDERWRQRSASLESAQAAIVYLDPAQRQLDEATKWYEEYGRYAAVDFSDDNWEDVRNVSRGRPKQRERGS
ncbi:hypothetical protein O1611_g8259 [Lasiodiplodia mahajangana]|uniref:Uncharacterized protein n=1 Tax=Lasiodiplodia mahajangana TaxID=1108764 RepID=A0ACC2JD81_9PEZI|nr:hypothetical protein O1611_g8259 [Lasiodiplodia mahajangana]